jgi:hypothetical protein
MLEFESVNVAFSKMIDRLQKEVDDVKRERN